MSTHPFPDASALEQLSALVDGELDSASVGDSCEAWKCDSQARASWHAYQLIGDVLRSDDLAADPGHDAAFLNKLSARLGDEPVAFAPGPMLRGVERTTGPASADAARRGRGWMAPSAVAAGFALVVGVFLVNRPDLSPSRDAGSTLAGGAPTSAAAPDRRQVATSTAVDGGEPTALLASGAGARSLSGADRQADLGAGTSGAAPGQNPTVLRDPRLDTYLAAHKQFAGSSALGVPSVFFRSATVAAPRR